MQPIARFLQINELHIQNRDIPRKHYAGIWDRSEWLFEAIRTGHFGELDFVLGLGDLVDGPGMEEIEADLQELQQIMGEMPCPLYPSVGNHDIGRREGDTDWHQPMLKAFNQTSTNYTFEAAGINFVMLNNAGTTQCTQDVYDARAAWLGKALDETPGPIFLCCHMPLVAMRDQETLIKSSRFESWKCREPEALEIVNRHRDKVAAVISGHLHLTGKVEADGIVHIDIAGVASYPSDVAVYTVFEDHVDVEVQQLPEHVCKLETNIHGRPRHEQDFFDESHPTLDLYLRGNPNERQFRIPLKP